MISSNELFIESFDILRTEIVDSIKHVTVLLYFIINLSSIIVFSYIVLLRRTLIFQPYALKMLDTASNLLYNDLQVIFHCEFSVKFKVKQIFREK